MAKRSHQYAQHINGLPPTPRRRIRLPTQHALLSSPWHSFTPPNPRPNAPALTSHPMELHRARLRPLEALIRMLIPPPARPIHIRRDAQIDVDNEDCQGEQEENA